MRGVGGEKLLCSLDRSKEVLHKNMVCQKGGADTVFLTKMLGELDPRYSWVEYLNQQNSHGRQPKPDSKQTALIFFPSSIVAVSDTVIPLKPIRKPKSHIERLI